MKQRLQGKPPSTTSALFAKPDGGVRTTTSCIYCNGKHLESEFEEVKTIEERKNLIYKQGQCFICLNINHRTFECHFKGVCSLCKCKHHILICNAWQEVFTHA